MINSVKHLIDSSLSTRRYPNSQFLQSRLDNAHNLYSKDLRSHHSCVNALEFSNRESDHFASGGDDKRVLIWSIDRDLLSTRSQPHVLKNQHHSNIFTLAWDHENRRVFSGGNDHQVLVHDLEKQQLADLFPHENAVMCVSVQPDQSDVFASACKSGEVNLYDLRSSNGEPVLVASSDHGAFESCAFNPVRPNEIATAHVAKGVQIVDLKMPGRPLMRFKSGKEAYEQNVSSVRFNERGDQLLAMRSKLPPVLYSVDAEEPLCQFDHEGFLNSCTAKSCCFVGDRDQYVCSGSDDFGVYIWKCPSEKSQKWVHEAHLKLRGHRSIVNQVRYNSKFHLLISSGVEKIVKAWSPYPTPNCSGGLMGRQDEYVPERKLFTNRELFALNWSNPFQSIISPDLNNNESRAEEEDHMILAFFDSLVRKEMLNWVEDEDERERIVGLGDYESSEDGLQQADESDEDDEDDDDNEEDSRPSRRSVVLFESDNEVESNDNEWSSSSESLASNSRPRFRLRNRQGPNLQGDGFLNVIEALNAAPGDDTGGGSVGDFETVSQLIGRGREGYLRDCRVQPEEIWQVDTRPTSERLRVVKSLNEHRRLIELNGDAMGDTRLIGDVNDGGGEARTSEDVTFRRARTNSEGAAVKKYRCSPNVDSTDTNRDSSGDEKDGNSPKRIKL